jgi:hypothetical protein
MAESDDRNPNWLQIRERIDAGKTLDKNTPPEPAMATFGTDDEAAGHYTAPPDIARSAGPEAEVQAGPRSRSVPVWAYMAGGIAVVALAVILMSSLGS